MRLIICITRSQEVRRDPLGGAGQTPEKREALEMEVRFNGIFSVPLKTIGAPGSSPSMHLTRLVNAALISKILIINNASDECHDCKWHFFQSRQRQKEHPEVQ